MPNNSLLYLEDALIILLAIARANLSRSRRDTLFPLAEYNDAYDFATQPWVDLPLDEQEVQSLRHDFCNFFDIADDGKTATCPADFAESKWQTWLNGKRNLQFSTSGSTGAPKLASVSIFMAEEEVRKASGALPPCESIISVTPPHHSYGFHMALLLARLREKPLRILPPIPTLARNLLVPGCLLVGFPLFWQGLARMLESGSAMIPAKVHGLSSTASCPPGLFNRLQAMGFASMSEIYGSSETGAVGIRHKEDAPFTLLDHWSPLQPQPKDHAKSAYSSEQPDAIVAHIPQKGKISHQTPDCLRWVSTRDFFVQGRRDKAVQVAGVNVYPDFVANFFKELPGVADCAVRLTQPEEGGRLKAFIVPKPGFDEAELRLVIRQKIMDLTPAERPALLTFGQKLPCGFMGKLTDW